ncbi:MAG: hypothetical protein F4Z40_03675 [Chloroflexi bacterium]|nr:hypothetical protein [Chloroflexota bacterium]
MSGPVNYQLGDKHPKFDEVMRLVDLTNSTLRYNLSQIAPELTQALILVGDDDDRGFVHGMLFHARAMVHTGLPGFWESDEAEIVHALSKAIEVFERTIEDPSD